MAIKEEEEHEEERKAFEEWVINHPHFNDSETPEIYASYWLERSASAGTYCSVIIQGAWMGWLGAKGLR